MKFERRDYFRAKFEVEELRSILTASSVTARDVLSTRSKAYRSAPAAFDVLSEDELLLAMVEEPTLIRRPMIVAGGAIVVGFDRAGLQVLTGVDNGKE